MSLYSLASTVKGNTIRPRSADDGIIFTQPRKSSRVSAFECGCQDCPEGLEALATTEHVFLKQSVYRTLETHYEVLNSEGESIFMADELTDTSANACCRGTQPFDISLFIRKGRYRKEVMKLDGEPRSCGCGGDISVKLTKCSIGKIEQDTDCNVPKYYIMDGHDRVILHILGPSSGGCFRWHHRSSNEFKIIDPYAGPDAVIGKIAKYWGGKEKEVLMKSDIWGVKFPLEMRIPTKALLLAACFLLHFQFHDGL